MLVTDQNPIFFSSEDHWGQILFQVYCCSYKLMHVFWSDQYELLHATGEIDPREAKRMKEEYQRELERNQRKWHSQETREVQKWWFHRCHAASLQRLYCWSSFWSVDASRCMSDRKLGSSVHLLIFMKSTTLCWLVLVFLSLARYECKHHRNAQSRCPEFWSLNLKVTSVFFQKYWKM